MTENIQYIGVDDLDLDLFESQYAVPDGMSYNSYVILDSKIAIMDTVDERKSAEWMENVEKALGGKTPDYLVVHHLEPDHSGCIGLITARYPEMKLVMSARAAGMLAQFHDGLKAEVISVKENDKLSLGKHELTFAMAPMVHWPEVMVSYESCEKVLFSADAFGKFGALARPDDDWACEARRYYFNICGKFGGPVKTLLAKAEALDIATICPLHGPALEGNLSYYLNLYKTWSNYDVEAEGVFIAYASIHGNTAKAVERLAEILKAEGAVKVSTMDLCRDDIHEAVEDAFKYGRMILAASSYDGGVFTPMHNFLHILQIKAYQKRRIGIVENGSWAPSAARTMKDMLAGMKDIEIAEPTVTLRARMKDSDTAAMTELAKAMLK